MILENRTPIFTGVLTRGGMNYSRNYRVYHHLADSKCPLGVRHESAADPLVRSRPPGRPCLRFCCSTSTMMYELLSKAAATRLRHTNRSYSRRVSMVVCLRIDLFPSQR